MYASSESLSPITQTTHLGDSTAELIVSFILNASSTFFNCPQRLCPRCVKKPKYLDTNLPVIIMKNGGSKCNPNSQTVIKSLFAFGC